MTKNQIRINELQQELDAFYAGVERTNEITEAVTVAQRALDRLYATVS